MSQILPIDYALAIWRINPKSEYRLNKSTPPDQVILEWRGPGTQPTVAELRAAWEAYLDEVAAEDAADAAAEQAKKAALARLRQSANPETLDLVTVVERLESRLPVAVISAIEVEQL